MTSKKSSKSSRSGRLKQASTDELVLESPKDSVNQITDILHDPNLQDANAELQTEVVKIESDNDADIHPEIPTLTELIVANYVGEKEKGHFHGPGIVTFINGNTYEGNFVNGMMHGEGKFNWVNTKTKYEGEFVQNKIIGKGFYQWPNGSTYEGEVYDGVRHGYGVYCHPNGLQYAGHWKNGQKHGKGKLCYDSAGKSYYEGDWQFDRRHGFGRLCYASGNVYEGMWYNGLRHGHGTMSWFDKDEVYTGQWEDGVQHGQGHHVWIVKRVTGSQFLLRNFYEGEFFKGKRQGFGVFSYPSGARYEGHWMFDMKNGEGKFIFKNGRVFEGQFYEDRMLEFPQFDGRLSTPDTSTIRTRSPLPGETESIHSNLSTNTISPSFQLVLDHLFTENKLSDSESMEEEIRQVTFVAIHFLGKLRKVYDFYSQLGCPESNDNTHVMSLLQFWRFVKDCKLSNEDWTLTAYDREICASYEEINPDMLHNPSRKVLFRDFVNHLVTISYLLYAEEAESGKRKPLLAYCLRKVIQLKVLPNACTVKGYMFANSKKTEHVVNYLDKSFHIFLSSCKPRKRSPHDMTLTLRQFIHMLQDIQLVNDNLSAVKIVDVLCYDDEYIRDDGFLLLDREMTFLEFFEALIGCAEIYVTDSVIQSAEATDSLAEILGRIASTYLQQKTEQEEPPLPDDSSLHVPEPVHDSGSLAEGDVADVSQLISEPPKSPADHKTKPGDILKSDSKKGKMSTKSLHPEPGKTSKDTVKDRQVSRNSKEDKKSDGKKSGRSNDKEVREIETPNTNPQEEETGEPVPLAELSQMNSEATLQISPEDQEEQDNRLFNFWTHQVHEFFLHRFFPAAEFHDLLQTRLEAFSRPSHASSIVPDSLGMTSPGSESRRYSEEMSYPAEKENTQITVSEVTEEE